MNIAEYAELEHGTARELVELAKKYPTARVDDDDGLVTVVVPSDADIGETKLVVVRGRIVAAACAHRTIVVRKGAEGAYAWAALNFLRERHPEAHADLALWISDWEAWAKASAEDRGP